MRAPAFWHRDAPLARWLAPLGVVTALLTARRVARLGWNPPVTVFCCGNATMGGAGKTTLALDLGARLRARGRTVHFLTRGYGGKGGGLVRVDPAIHAAAAVGDEPLLLAQVGPCWVSGDRAAAGRAAVKAGAEVLVMDDGLQNPGIARRRSALVIDGASGFGNGRLFPAGPLREPVSRAAARCDIAILIGADETGALTQIPRTLPVLRARLVPQGLAQVAGRRVHAFAGLARPEKFFRGLAEAGVTLVGQTGFADHYRYTRREVEALIRLAESQDAVAATTPKDAVRLPRDLRERLVVIGVALEWERPAAIERWLDAA